MRRMRFAPLMVVAVFPSAVIAGPPFLTDDPEPVDVGHWEAYLASQFAFVRDETSGTAPHLEINYGPIADVQLHLIAPFEYVKAEGEGSSYGFGDMEVGIKYRFFEDEERGFQIGTFPLVEIPTGNQSRGLGNGEPQVFLPLWLQKSWGPWLTYGGGGFWYNPGPGNRDYGFLGWEVQRELGDHFTLGTEIFYQTPDTEHGESEMGFNVGAIVNVTDHHHLLLSAGRDIAGPNTASFYVAYQLTF